MPRQSNNWAEKCLEIEKLSGELSTFIRSLEERVAILQQENEELRQVEQITTVNNKVNTSLLSVMGHELRAPLAGVMNMVQMLEATRLNRTQSSYLYTLQASSHTLRDLIGDMLDLAKLEEGTFELVPKRINLHGLITEIIESFSPIASEKANRTCLSLRHESTQIYSCGCRSDTANPEYVALKCHHMYGAWRDHVVDERN